MYTKVQDRASHDDIFRGLTQKTINTANVTQRRFSHRSKFIWITVISNERNIFRGIKSWNMDGFLVQCCWAHCCWCRPFEQWWVAQCFWIVCSHNRSNTIVPAMIGITIQRSVADVMATMKVAAKCDTHRSVGSSMGSEIPAVMDNICDLLGDFKLEWISYVTNLRNSVLFVMKIKDYFWNKGMAAGFFW